MKRLSYLFLLTLMLMHVVPTYAVSTKKFSSVSTVRRELEMEKARKEKLKQLKKDFDDVKDVAIETWADGRTYYVLYGPGKDFSLMPIDSDKPYFCYGKRIDFKPDLELVERKGYRYFKIYDDWWASYDGVAMFHPTDFKEFGGKEYIYFDNKPVRIYTLDGEELIMSDNIEFRAAEPEGYSYDPETRLSFYHPALPDRFFGMSETPHLSKYGVAKLFDLGDFKKKNHQAQIKVPGGEYYVAVGFPLPYEVKTEIREDINGVMHEYRVFEAKGEYEFTNDLKLLLHNGKTGRSILPQSAYKVKLSTPDQIAYYTQFDNDNRFSRMGAVSLIDSSFVVPPRFADVKVFYDAERKPYAMVKMSMLGNYELYDSSKDYDYLEMSELEMDFECGLWQKLVDKVKTAKIEDLPVGNLYPWIYAEIELLKSDIDYRSQELVRLQTFTLYKFEEDEIMNESTTSKILYSPIDFGRGYDVEKAIAFHSSNLSAEQNERLQTMASYLKNLNDQKSQLEALVASAKKDYRLNKQHMMAQQDAERQRRIYEAEQARQSNNAVKQAMVLNVLGSIFGSITSNATSSLSQTYAPGGKKSASSVVTGTRMIDQTYVSPEITGAAISAGWQPESPANQSVNTSTSSHSKPSGNLCHSCYGSGKCALCNGAGRYMPNLDGKYIDCSSCGKSGVCKHCGGKGHH